MSKKTDINKLVRKIAKRAWADAMLLKKSAGDRPLSPEVEGWMRSALNAFEEAINHRKPKLSKRLQRELRKAERLALVADLMGGGK